MGRARPTPFCFSTDARASGHRPLRSPAPNAPFAELSALEDLQTNRITRILTTDFPQYFAVVSRTRQEVHAVGPEGGMLSSTVVPQVQAIFPEGALTKKIRVGLQVTPPPSYLAQVEALSEEQLAPPLSPSNAPPPPKGRGRRFRALWGRGGAKRAPPKKAGFFAQLVRRSWPRLNLFSQV